MRRVQTLVFALLCLVALAARAAHTQATLVLSDDTAKPGDTVWAGVDLKMDPGWHTYWKNSGDAGIPTTISWQLPPGVTAGDIQWPLPQKFPPIEVTTYGYEGETMLLVPLTIGTNVPPGPITLTANLAWLECQDVCIPVKTSVQATLNIGTETKPSADAGTIGSWKTKRPRSSDGWQMSGQWEMSTNSDTKPLLINGLENISDITELPFVVTAADDVDFFPDSDNQFEVLAPTERLSAKMGFSLLKNVKLYSSDWPKEIGGVIVITSKGHQFGFNVRIPIASVSNPPAGNTPPLSSLVKYLFFAFIGGLILNVMPCVLPVIALKILGFVSEAHSEPRRVRNLGFIYALGVLASFSLLAALFIGLTP